ncbi:MAG: VWA domain-containing protein [Candidatus Ranarchaeia archaeon]
MTDDKRGSPRLQARLALDPAAELSEEIDRRLKQDRYADLAAKIPINEKFDAIKDLTRKAVDQEVPNLNAIAGMARVNKYAVSKVLSKSKNLQIIARAAASGSYTAMQILLSLRAPLEKSDQKRLTSLAKRSIQIYAPNRLGQGIRPEISRLEPSVFGESGELALEETLENILETKPTLINDFSELEQEDILIKERYPKQKTAVLILDTSGSMHGGRLSIAATAAALIAHHLTNDYLGIITYAQVPIVLQRLTDIPDSKRTSKIITSLLTVQPIGHTNLEAALIKGYKELLRTPPNTPKEDRWALLLTDGVYSMGEDPLNIARKFPHLHVLATPTSHEKIEPPGQGRNLLKQMAKVSNGKYAELPPDRPEILPTLLTKLLSNIT